MLTDLSDTNISDDRGDSNLNPHQDQQPQLKL